MVQAAEGACRTLEFFTATWVQAMTAEGKSAATVNVKLSDIRQWLDWLARHGFIKGNPAGPVRGI